MKLQQVVLPIEFKTLFQTTYDTTTLGHEDLNDANTTTLQYEDLNIKKSTNFVVVMFDSKNLLTCHLMTTLR